MKDILLYILNCYIHEKDVNISRLNGMEDKDWQKLYLIGKKQGVNGLVFDKIKSLPKDVAPPKELILKWMSHSISIERHSKALLKKSIEFAELMSKYNLQTIVLKGLTLSKYYPTPWLREYGDLDCYFYEEKEGTISWDDCYKRGNIAAEKEGLPVKKGFYKHSHIKYKGMEVENHQFSLPVKDGDDVKAMERELRRLTAQPDGLYRIGNTHLMLPSADFNALFLVAHSMNHFLFESIKLRHVVDWALFIKTEHKTIDWENFWKWCDKMQYTRFVKCLNYICEHHFGMDLPIQIQVEKEKIIADLSKRILSDIYAEYSLYSQKCSYLTHRIMIVHSYIKGFWKFQHVYQRNAIWLLTKRTMSMLIHNIKL